MSRRTLPDCLIELKAAGELNDAEVRHLNDEFEKLRQQYRLDLGDDAAALKAVDTLAKALFEEANLKRAAAAHQAVVTTRIRADLIDYRDAKGRANIGEAIEAHYVDSGRGGRIRSLESASKAVLGHLQSIFADGIEAFTRRNLASGAITKAAQLENMVREVFGQATGDASAKALADAWRKVTDYTQGRYRAAGAVLGKIENYMPQWHDPRALRNVGLDQWRDHIMPKLDRDKMIDYTTGAPLGDAELRNLLREIYNTITTEGWNEREPQFRQYGTGALWKRRAHERHLIFKDADGWMEYERSFGSGHPLAAMWRHMNVMARDIATLEVFGTSPQATHEWMKQIIQQEYSRAAAGRPALVPQKGESATRRGSKLEARIEDEWSIFRGAAEIPVDSSWATAWHVLRQDIVSSALGAAFITSFSDAGVADVARRFAGVHGVQLKGVFEQGFAPNLTRGEAARAAMVVDSAIRMIHRQARYVKGLDVRHVAEVVTDRVLTWSFLTPWTSAGKHAMQFAFFAEAADQVGKTFDALPDAFRRTLERHGIDQTDWNVMRQAKLYDRDGAKWLRPTDVFLMEDGPAIEGLMKPLLLTGADEKLARRMARQGLTRIGEKWAMAVMSEAERGIPSASIFAKRFVVGPTRPGSLPGELSRSFGLFKSYPLMFLTYWGDRIGAEWARDPRRAARYGFALFATVSGYGVISEQLHQVAGGKDVRPWDDPKTYGAGMLRGGGLGIFGDFMFHDYTRYGASIGEQVAGAMFSSLTPFARSLTKAGKAASEGEDTTLAADLSRATYNMLPGRSLWYLNLAGQRYIKDGLTKALDPEADKKFRRMRSRLENDSGQQYWWAPGDTFPSRLPSFTSTRGRESEWLQN